MKPQKKYGIYLFGEYSKDKTFLIRSMYLISAIIILYTCWAMYHTYGEENIIRSVIKEYVSQLWEYCFVVLCLFSIVQIVRTAFWISRGYTWDFFQTDAANEPLTFNLDVESFFFIVFVFFCIVAITPFAVIFSAMFVIKAMTTMGLWMISLLSVVLVGIFSFIVAMIQRKKALERLEILNKLQGGERG